MELIAWRIPIARQSFHNAPLTGWSSAIALARLATTCPARRVCRRSARGPYMVATLFEYPFVLLSVDSTWFTDGLKCDLQAMFCQETSRTTRPRQATAGSTSSYTISIELNLRC